MMNDIYSLRDIFVKLHLAYLRKLREYSLRSMKNMRLIEHITISHYKNILTIVFASSMVECLLEYVQIVTYVAGWIWQQYSI